MFPKTQISVLIAFAAFLWANPLLARPTRPSVRTSGHRSNSAPVFPALSHTALRPQAARGAAGKRSVTHAAGTRASVAAHHASSPAPASTRAQAVKPPALSRVHAWEALQRKPATRSSVATARISAEPETAYARSTSPGIPPADEPDSGALTAPRQSLLAGSSDDLVATSTELPPIKSIEEEAVTPVFLPPARSLLSYDMRGRLIVPAPLYGSHEVLLHQNEMADHDGLTRVQDDAGLLDLRRQKKLVALPEDETLRVDYHLPANRRFSRPWTAEFLAALAHDHYAIFHLPIQVDSAVRTVAVQRHLLRTNGNAAPAAGDTASPHLTGQAVDIAKSSLSLTEIAWMRAYLQPFIDQGKIDVEEEFQQACFHISVYRKYLPATPPQITVAATPPLRQNPLGSQTTATAPPSQ
jgi:hypothetical protein